MPQPVSNPTDIPSCRTGTQSFGFVPKPDCGFAYDQQFTFDSGNCFGVFTEGIEIHPAGELLDHSDGVNDIAQ
jgi:hypothetical protein